MTPQKRQKEKIKERIRLSNEAEANGLPPDPWVVTFRIKNNEIKAKWKASKPKREIKKATENSAWFKKGQKPIHAHTEEQRQASKEKWRENTRKWHSENKDKVNAQRREKRKNNPAFKIQCNLRKRLSFLVRKSIESKTEQTMDLLGCTMPEFMKHLESGFTEGMSFSNYGEWHIDHKIACAKFDLTKLEDRQKCFYYTNLQPLWREDNLRKNKY